jgi:hypothetical protein
MAPVGFEPMIPASAWPQTYALQQKMFLQEALLTHLHFRQQAEYSLVSKRCQIFYICDQEPASYPSGYVALECKRTIVTLITKT